MSDPLDIDYDSPDDNEHTVEIVIRLAGNTSERGGFGSNAERDRVAKLEDTLDGIVERAGVGLLDGNEIGGGEYSIFLIGPDATALWSAIEDTVRHADATRGAKVILRHGDGGAEQIVRL